MNQTTLKNFAQEARRELLKQVALRLNYWIGGESAKSRVDSAEHRQFAPQVKELEAAAKQEGREALIERVAYTWFNRLAALRFMDANGYHPFGAKVVMPATANDTLPEILQQARAGTVDPDLRACFGNAKAFDDLLAGKIPVPHLETAVYRALLVAACNYYQRLMPFMFEKIGDATELLLPEDLLTEHSILHAFRTELADDDCRDVEVIGWLYQYYISDKKDEVMGRNAAVPKEDIPAVTQLFTPHWIVRYLVENSLGRLWLLNRPNSRLREKMPYFIDEGARGREGDGETGGLGDKGTGRRGDGETGRQGDGGTRRQGDELPGLNVAQSLSPTVAPSPLRPFAPSTDAAACFLKINAPEEIRLLDPACGSGHMLTYAYDLLYAIYAEEGYDEKDIPGLILKHNLYGVEICDRAAALAAFALCMKARSSDSRFFRRVVQPNVIALQDVRFDKGELAAYFKAIGTQPSSIHSELLNLLHQFEEAKNFGALIQPCLDAQAMAVSRRAIEAKNLGGQLFLRETHLKVLRVIEQAVALSQRYHIAVANPPYMGRGAMNSTVALFADAVYPKSKADLFAMFIERNIALLLPRGFNGMVTMQSWMFLPTFEALRRSLLAAQTTVSMAHLGARGFDSISGEVVQTTAFVLCKQPPGQVNATFSKLVAGNSEQEKAELFLAGNCRFTIQQSALLELPKAAFAYWLSPQIRSAYVAGKAVEQVTISDGQTKTGDNDRFLRQLWEISAGEVGFGRKWVLHPKGGGNRKWYGNTDFVINWSEAARVHYRKDRVARILPDYLWRRRGICWSNISTSSWLGFRLLTADEIFNLKSPALFLKQDEQLSFLLGFLNTPIASYLVSSINPTISFNVKDVQDLPLHDFPTAQQNIVAERVDASIAIARADWDNFETSWDFRDLPLLRAGHWTVDGGRPGGDWKGATLGEAWKSWKVYCDAAIRRMQELEAENNRLFIDAYGLQDELKPEVPEEQITLARADARKDMAAFVSYAVGCMFGRYSLDAPGLILADAGATVADYLAKVPKPTFAPDEDGILPVLDGEWFADDIVARFREFLKVTFGEANLEANLAFIETALGKDLRKYFVRDFYKNHLSNERAYGYKKRPIYWMVSSPEGSFQALIYLHRYTRDTMNLLLNDYVREFAHKLEERQRQLTAIRLNEAARTGDRTTAVKELGKIEKMLKELREWERDILLPFAQQRVEINLDDGVKVNYLKFKGVLVPIPGLEKKDEE